MKYIVITSKHHEGFAMYPSALTDWSLKSTPFKRDPLKELATACREEGLKLCFYHSIMDWHHPDYLPHKPWNDEANPNPDFNRYVAHLKGQLKELLTGYGPIGILWFDGQWEDTWNYDRGVDLYKYIRSLQPDIIINNRVGRDRAGVAGMMEGQQRVGDYGTPEQTIPAMGLGAGVDWETCMTMNDTWGFKKQDQHWKSTRELIKNLVDIASKGGNYLLNIGPTGEGLIPEASLDRLKEIGQWMSVNGEAIYGTTASPFGRQSPWGRCTSKTKGDMTKLYLHVFVWPADGKLFVPGLMNMKSKVTAAYLLANPASPLGSETSEDGTTISVPLTAPDAISSTVVLEFKGAPEILPTLITQTRDGAVVLPASEARLHGGTFRYESGGQLDNIGYWTTPEDWADWEFKVTKPGEFTVAADIAALASGEFKISIGGQTIHCSAPNTGNYTAFACVKLGIVRITAGGKAVLAVRPIKEGWQPMNLKAIRLEPVGSR
jgi:alpha-L-fucosidase